TRVLFNAYLITISTSISIPGVLTLPEALPAKSSAAAGGGAGGGGGDTAHQIGGDTGSEYGDYDEEEPQKAPGNLAKSTASPKLPAPFFNQKAVNVYVPDNATSVRLECPVKNYNAEHHVILWYKDDDNQLSSGSSLMNKIYQLDKQFALIVPLASNATEQRYSCSVMPSNVRRQVTIRFGPEPSTPAPVEDPSPSGSAATTPAPAESSAPGLGLDVGLALLLAAIQWIRGPAHF
ncbi:hypothetical protein KR018_011366, partial [Drosophila ironensis]